MKNILIEIVNDKGNSVRISTNKPNLTLDVFYKVGKDIRKCQLDLNVIGPNLAIQGWDGMIFMRENSMQIEGKLAEKL